MKVPVRGQHDGSVTLHSHPRLLGPVLLDTFSSASELIRVVVCFISPQSYRFKDRNQNQPISAQIQRNRDASGGEVEEETRPCGGRCRVKPLLSVLLSIISSANSRKTNSHTIQFRLQQRGSSRAQILQTTSSLWHRFT